MPENFALPKSSCSLFAIIVTLFLIFVLLMGGILYSRMLDLKSTAKVQINTQSIDNLQSKFSQSLDEQKSEPEANLSITESDLNQLINGTSNFPLKNPKATIDENMIVISGKTGTSIFALTVDVGIVPRAENGKVVYDIKEIKAGGVPAPQQLSDTVSKSLSDFISSSMPSFNQITVGKVTLHSKYLDVTGKKS